MVARLGFVMLGYAFFILANMIHGKKAKPSMGKAVILMAIFELFMGS